MKPSIKLRTVGDGDFHQCFDILSQSLVGSRHPENIADSSPRRKSVIDFLESINTADEFASFINRGSKNDLRIECLSIGRMVVGVVTYRRIKLETGGVRASLRPFAVLPALWRCGLGRLMLDQLFRRRPRTPRRSAICEISFDASEFDLGSQLFLSKSGFRCVDTFSSEDEVFYQMVREKNRVCERTRRVEVQT